MNLNKIKPKKEIEDLLLSIIKNCETLVKQTYTKPQETLQLKPTKPSQTFSIKPSISLDFNWMIGLPSLEIYNSVFRITAENNKFVLQTDLYNEFF